MRRLGAFATLTFILIVPQACIPKTNKGTEQSQDLVAASMGGFASVIYSYPESYVCSTERTMTLLFTGDDLKHPIFSSIANTPKSAYEPGSVCAIAAEEKQPLEIRLKLKKSDGSQDVLVSTSIGCGQELSPDVTGVIPPKLLDEIKQVLHPKSTNLLAPY
ncbi:MAG TPA: hypothetical protein VE954_17440 [Oligoflexus sp.]|uniref:hypothetical protein n=1 Tax=Oligoflexus sp. TaxID=1971216 RepID=UPI002D222CB0|nr:hypothetical protein [Oligoflexus sp.]HYX34884.1 hypothetical protein [Oligoflexus sp.]